MDTATPEFSHTTVLLHETVDAVLTSPDGIYVDGTYGRGGHSRLLLSRLGESGRLIAIDRDLEAIAAATSGDTRVDDPRFSICHSAFAEMRAQLAALGVEQVQGILLDLGVSSPQIDNPERGFSFRFSGPLDMRMDTTRGESAADFLARADERQIAEVIRNYGEERFASQIAKALVARREIGSAVRSTDELSKVVAGAVKTREPGQDPATRTFQALRIHVNAELEELEQGLNAALRLLAPGGRLAVISFHSLEDRIVKNFITAHSKEVFDRRAPFAEPQALALTALGRIKPSETEVRANPRSRSAILRVAERTEAPLPIEHQRHKGGKR
ncbi:16S rRNA (cytosine(1402)-N(4))-methyltransferase RsmH [Paucibacter sp. PLA-PC-4]|uniref:16S rRNA (cytosine(1402)-N(4))-methyltransferase RsmH n=1 Tax=Paucibacter sp. PLA-PC-4 TaxID=2993655 RepID=UPI00224908CE|nr:16S rRNA (cytosine(1402)-N(4))-methyltransferase RsmH [Paucibacter sp. PLA-PC-4]MCX2861300.1 16S rRNA (cytosine(1402)-N(4))-methyltransferase RsmH [Paucibacter sp. PLA-PC-4]